jgi:hypothetical protein
MAEKALEFAAGGREIYQGNLPEDSNREHH